MFLQYCISRSVFAVSRFEPKSVQERGLHPDAHQIIGRVFGCFPPSGAEAVSPLLAVRTRWRQSAKARMRPTMVVIVAPRFDGCPGLGQAQE
jgi:hypothetical protein